MRLLFLTHRLPYAPNRGDRARAYHIIKSLAPRMDLEVVSLAHDPEEAAQAGRVRELGARVSVFEVPRWSNRIKALPQLLGSRPLTHMLLDAPGIASALQEIADTRPPDVVLAYCSGMARFALEPPLDRFPLVVDLVDVDSAKWAALARERSWPLRWVYSREARALASFERAAAVHARQTLVVNEREADLARALAPSAPVRVVPNGVDLAVLQPAAPPSAAAELVFCGVMNYQPNVDGVLWFARDIWPRIRAARGDAHVTIVGADPVDGVRELATANSGITVTGTVPDVRPHLWNAAVSIAPLKTARGVQNKVLEALAAGLPVVITSAVADGLPPEARPGCAVADTPEEFAAAVLALLSHSPEERRATATGADLASLTWERQLEPLYRICLEAASPNHVPQASTVSAPT